MTSVAALVTALFIGAAANAAQVAEVPSLPTNVYDVAHPDVSVAYTAHERGPPALNVGTPDLAVDRGSGGATYDYDDRARLVPSNSVTGTTSVAVRTVHVVHGLLQQGGVAANAVDDGVSLSLRYKPGWNAAQRSAADAKVAALNDAAGAGALRVTPVQRAGTSASSRYRSAGGTVPRGADVDHTIDLQMGGLNDIANMSPLDMSVNRSLGSQIMWQLRGVEPGTCVISVVIC